MSPNFERAMLLFQQSRFELAEKELRQGLAEAPDEAYGHALLALCLTRQEKFEEATAEAQRAIGLQPDFEFAHYALASVMEDRRRLPEARAAILEAIRLDSSDADNFALLASVEFQESHWAEALKAAERGLECDAEHVACTNLRAMALVKLGRKSEAGLTIDEALRRNPENSLSHANQGWTWLEKGDPKKAAEHFKEALRLNPQQEWARQGMVEALKAKNFIYAWMLKYFLWMGRFSTRGQWAIVIGGMIGNSLLGQFANSNPDLAPYILPIRILYIVFALMTWLAYPFFNMLLRMSTFGRMVLSEEETTASNWFGACLFCAMISLAGTVVYGFDSAWLIAALVFGVLLLPLSSIFRTEPGWPRKVMIALTLALLVVGFMSVATFAMAAFESGGAARRLNRSGAGWLNLFIIGGAASTWIINLVRSQRMRR